MSGNEINRRDFLKFVGIGGASAAALSGCDMPTTVTLEEGKEKVVAYLAPEEYAIPGVGVWFASTCQQCDAGCGVHGRVREGRLLKLEGNPGAAINGGGLCQMGQAGLQGHYNPDRLSKPLVRKNGSLVEVSWSEAWALVEEKAGAAKGDRVAWLTGSVSGHQAALLSKLQDSVGSKNHFVYEVINNRVAEAVNEAMLGEAVPRYRLDKAKAILSFGADFLGTWVSPIHFTQEYAKFRSGDRGVLITVEPKMTLTGSNSDLWVAIRPGTEGVLALGIANVLLSKHQIDGSRLPAAARDVIAQYTPDKVTEITGVAGDTVVKIASYLKQRSPSLVLSGASAQNHVNGYQSAAAIMMLNVLLGNVGQTIESSGGFPVKELSAKRGSSKALTDFAALADQGVLDVAFIYGANPVFSAPAHMKFEDKLAKVHFKVALTLFVDETAAMADVVLPLASPYESWGTMVAAYQPQEMSLGMQQPLMQPLYTEVRSFGDVLLAMLKKSSATEYQRYDDYYAYLRNAMTQLPSGMKQGKSESEFWDTTVQKGLLTVSVAAPALKTNVPDLTQKITAQAADFPLHLVPSARLGLWDGRHANLPWLQEAPDQVSKVYWDSWAELHPKTATQLGVKEGDVIRIESDQGAIEAQVYIFKGVHPEAVAVPMGQGHENYGRYASKRGVNPLKIVSAAADEKTGEIATHATRVRITKTGKSSQLPRLGGSDRQVGRRLVGTVTADVFRKTEGGGNVA